MSKQQHTPGPLHVGGTNSCTIYDRFGQRVANTFEGVMATQRSDAECQANARIFAATNDMLDALIIAEEAITATIEEMTVGDRFTNAGQFLLDAVIPVRAAIAKARGES